MKNVNLVLGYIMIVCGMGGSLMIGALLVIQNIPRKTEILIKLSNQSGVQLNLFIYLGLIAIAGAMLVNGNSKTKGIGE